tara:strand:+ start:271 stop:738 length:468 start_codon:yes stop_codon:yes gene_type:complete
MKQKQKPLSFSLNPLNIEYIKSVVSKQKEVNSRYSRSMYMDDLITHLRTKSKPVKKKKSTALLSVDVEGLNIEAWDKWIAYRKTTKLKAYKTNAKKKELATMGNYDEQMQIVTISVNNEYAGLFPLKANNSVAKTAEHENTLDDTSWANNLDDVL